MISSWWVLDQPIQQAAVRPRPRRFAAGANRGDARVPPEYDAAGGAGGAPVPPAGKVVSGLATLLKRTWVDWAVVVYMGVTAARCESPFVLVLCTAVAVVAAVAGARTTWQLVRVSRNS
ncbi:hypothetical protein Snoj_67440 [Streptomyces nojiriensis]|uniref:Uncharacterized protein n=1 Tax=Streptomyces nojiriensis TaxID=66374 RepID=A0ABQ3SXK4_9ACTN|nr:hypothetical protein Snoj_67440 [Streptomyces nojiriensis]